MDVRPAAKPASPIALLHIHTHLDRAVGVVEHPAHLDVRIVHPDPHGVPAGGQQLEDEPEPVGNLEGGAVAARGREERLPLVGRPGWIDMCIVGRTANRSVDEPTRSRRQTVNVREGAVARVLGVAGGEPDALRGQALGGGGAGDADAPCKEPQELYALGQKDLWVDTCGVRTSYACVFRKTRLSVGFDCVRHAPPRGRGGRGRERRRGAGREKGRVRRCPAWLWGWMGGRRTVSLVSDV